jgi:hypothetical protein
MSSLALKLGWLILFMAALSLEAMTAEPTRADFSQWTITPTAGPPGTPVRVMSVGSCPSLSDPWPYEIYFGPTLVGSGVATNNCSVDETIVIPVGAPMGVTLLHLCEPNDEGCESYPFNVNNSETQAFATITTDKPTYNLGENIEICYTVSRPGDIRIVVTRPGLGSQTLLERPDDGTGDCFLREATGVGPRTLTITLLPIEGSGGATDVAVYEVISAGTTTATQTPTNTATPTPSLTPTRTPPGPVGTPTTPPPAGRCAEVDNLRIPANGDLAVVIVHGWALPNFEHDYFDDIEARLGSRGAAVYRLHWEQAAGVFPFYRDGTLQSGSGAINERSLGPRLTEAGRIGDCLGAALAGHQRIHFVTHSLGAWAVDQAADVLTPKGKKTHLTFMDAYVPGSARASDLGDNATYAEHFVSMPNSGWTWHTNEPLPEAHNFEVTNDTRLLWAEHGWPIQWYAESQSPGAGGTWELGSEPAGHGRYPEHAPTTCLAERCVMSKLPATEISDVDISGCVSVSSSRLEMKNCSPASARVKLSETAAWINVAVVTDTAGASVDFSFGPETFTLVVEPDGFNGMVWLSAPDGASELTIALRDTPDVAGALAVTGVASDEFVGSFAAVNEPPPPTTKTGGPLPPSTGNSEPLTRASFDAKSALVAGVLVTGMTLAVIGRRAFRR